jgi:hypothetical protein
MPVTISHPAAVIPLRRYLPFSALVVGSLSPDFEYPLRLAAVSRFSHTLPGIVYFCVPAGLLCLWLFHQLIKEPAILLLPPFVRRRVAFPSPRFTFWPARRLLVLGIAVALGALTHVAWDSLTHPYGWVVERCPPLQSTAFSLAGHELMMYKLLQYGSSVLGLLVLALYFLNWLRRTQVRQTAPATCLREPVRRRIVVLIVLLTLATSIGLGLRSAVFEKGFSIVQVFVVEAIIGAMIGFAASLLIYSFAFRTVASEQWVVGSK